MQDTNDLGSVPNPSMLALFKSLVNFLTSEAEGRGWEEISERLKAVENALAGKSGIAVKD